MTTNFTVPLDTNGEIYFNGEHSRAEHNHYRVTFRPPTIPLSEWVLIESDTTAYGLIDVYSPAGVLLAPGCYFAPGQVLHIPGASYGIPVALTRAGILHIQSSPAQLAAQTTFPRSVEQGVLYKGGIFPSARDAAVPELYYHPLSAPSSVAPLVIGLSGEPTYLAVRALTGFTVSHWIDALIVSFEVQDGAPAHIQTIGRIGSATSITNMNGYLHTHARLGIWAVPSATNPDSGATPPATLLSFVAGMARPYRRRWDLGFAAATTFGADSVLA